MRMSKDVKISVFKLEMVNDKKTYKVFDFKLDPKEMAKFKTEATVKRKWLSMWQRAASISLLNLRT